MHACGCGGSSFRVPHLPTCSASEIALLSLAISSASGCDLPFPDSCMVRNASATLASAKWNAWQRQWHRMQLIKQENLHPLSADLECELPHHIPLPHTRTFRMGSGQVFQPSRMVLTRAADATSRYNRSRSVVRSRFQAGASIGREAGEEEGSVGPEAAAAAPCCLGSVLSINATRASSCSPCWERRWAAPMGSVRRFSSAASCVRRVKGRAWFKRCGYGKVRRGGWDRPSIYPPSRARTG